MNIKQSGFIPAIAIIILGVIMVAGGAIVTLSIQNRVVNTNSATTTIELTEVLAPVSPRTETSTASTASVPIKKVETLIKQILPNTETVNSQQLNKDTTIDKSVRSIKNIDTQTAQDCKEINAAILSESNRSQLLSLKEACTNLLIPIENSSENEKVWLSNMQYIQENLVTFKKDRRITSLTWDTSILKTFLANPTPESFKDMCTKASSVQVPATKDGLSSDKTKIEQIPKTLSEVLDCGNLVKGYAAFPITENLLSWDFRDEDSDEVRKLKISYNDKLKNTLSPYKVLLVYPHTLPIDPNNYHLKVVTESEGKVKGFGTSFQTIIPEEIASQLVSDPTIVGTIGIHSHFFRINAKFKE